MASSATEVPETPASPNEHTSSVSSTEQDHRTIHAPVPTRPRLLSRKSSGPMVIPRDSDVGPVDIQFGPDDVRAMSPRRSSEDIEAMGREAREELKRLVFRSPLLGVCGRKRGNRYWDGRRGARHCVEGEERVLTVGENN